MSDEGEKTCPLCAEEMDLTDQQLKPCKCGYDICVWCWHHIMDMAEKDDTEGRCPACRTPYNKEKIVGTASKCERLVAEMSVEKKQKSQKGKTKTSEGRKQLSTVRVIQRNLVYIVGLPLNLADEDILQRKEYFGQYGKVLKVSISRTAAGSIQHFANNTCSVYITYSKEDEAVRSIQSVHGFVLEGRQLRACFGTTKYCHAWLRNMPCTNPDCLYLHEFGSQEDSFTKDEIISEYTRGRVQQVTGGVINDMQRRSGNILPPAADDYINNSTSSWAKPITKTTTNDPAYSMKGSPPNNSSSMKGSPPNSSNGRSVALPPAASWGTQASNSQPVPANVATSNGPSKQKTEVVSPSSRANETLKNHIEETSTTNGKSKSKVEPSESDESESSDKNLDVSDEGGIHKLSSDMSSSLSIGRSSWGDDNLLEPVTSNKAKKTADSVTNNNSVAREPDLVNKVEQQVAVSEVEADLLSFNDQRLRDPEVVTTHTSYTQNIPQSSHLNTLNMPLANGHGHSSNGDVNSHYEGSNGHSYFSGSRNQMGIFEDTTKRDYNNNNVNTNNGNGSVDLGENSIISNILSMDFDPWDESLTSPQNLAKLLGNNNNDKQQRVSSSSRKTQNCNQSRFSFAREEDDQIHGSNFTQNLSDFGSGLDHFRREFSKTDAFPSQLSDVNGFSSFNFEESDRTAGNHFSLSSNKIPVSRSQISAPPGFMGPSRAPPPGFTSNERIEPQTYENNLSGNHHMFDASSLLRKVHQAPAPPVYNNGGVTFSELEFMDPAILAIGGSRIPTNFPSQQQQHNSYENENRIRLLMQRSFSQQNHRFSDLSTDSGYSQRTTDSYGRLVEQAVPNNRSNYQQQGNYQVQQTRSSVMSNGHWDGWNEVQSGNGIGNGNDIAMAEILRNERLGFNKYYSGYEDTKFRMPSSNDLYNNRTFGI